MEPAEPAPEREPGNAGRRDLTAGCREAERLCLAIELAPGQAGLGACGSMSRIDPDTLHWREVDHHALVADRVARHVVAAPAHGHLETVGARELDRCDHVCGAGAA